MIKLDENVFMTQYVTTFLATWAAKRYDVVGEKPVRDQTPQITEALILARITYQNLLAYAVPNAPERLPICILPGCTATDTHQHGNESLLVRPSFERAIKP